MLIVPRPPLLSAAIRPPIELKLSTTCPIFSWQPLRFFVAQPSPFLLTRPPYFASYCVCSAPLLPSPPTFYRYFHPSSTYAPAALARPFLPTPPPVFLLAARPPLLLPPPPVSSSPPGKMPPVAPLFLLPYSYLQPAPFPSSQLLFYLPGPAFFAYSPAFSTPQALCCIAPSAFPVAPSFFP